MLGTAPVTRPGAGPDVSPNLSHCAVGLDGIRSDIIDYGEVAEWLKAAASKAVVPFNGTAGSNPALSASFLPFFRGPSRAVLHPFLEFSAFSVVGRSFNHKEHNERRET